MKGIAQSKEYKNGVWRKKKTNEEEVNKGNLGIFKKLLEVEEVCVV